MKLSLKGIICILLLLNSSYIALSSQIKANKANKLFFNKEKTSTIKFNRRNESKSKSSSSASSKLVWDDWTNPDYLLPVAYAKGVCSEFSMLKGVATILGVILNPKDTAAEFICEKVSDKVRSDTFKNVMPAKPTIKENAPTEEENKFLTELDKAETTAADFSTTKLTDFIKQAFSVSNEKVALEDKNICEDKFADTSSANISDILGQIDVEKEKDDLYFYDYSDQGSGISSNKDASKGVAKDSVVTGQSVQKQSDGYFTFQILGPFTNIKSKISNLTDKLNQEVQGLWAQCIENRVFDKALIVNQQQKSCYSRIEEKATPENKFTIKLYSNDKECRQAMFYETTKKDFFYPPCRTSLKEFYTKKETEVKDYEVSKAACLKKKADAAAAKDAKATQSTSILPRLYDFLLKFLKKVGKCVVISFITSLFALGVSIVVNILGNILTGGILAGLKILWYIGKALYYARKAWVIDDDKGTDAEKKELKRSKAENYGIATDSIIKIGLSLLGISKRKIRQNRFVKRLSRTTLKN